MEPNDMSYRREILAAAAAVAVAAKARPAVAAPVSVGLQCRTTDGGSAPERSFALHFTIRNRRWTEMEPGGTSDVFRTKSGDYVTVANVTSLRRDDASHTVVAVLNDFNPERAGQGDTGTRGHALETGRVFRWTVDIVVP